MKTFTNTHYYACQILIFDDYINNYSIREHSAEYFENSSIEIISTWFIYNIIFWMEIFIMSLNIIYACVYIQNAFLYGYWFQLNFYSHAIKALYCGGLRRKLEVISTTSRQFSSALSLLLIAESSNTKSGHL